MSDKLPVYGRILDLCGGNRSAADKVYAELVQKYYNTVGFFGTFDARKSGRDDRAEFQATNDGERIKRKRKDDDDDAMEVDSDAESEEDAAKTVAVEQSNAWLGDPAAEPPAAKRTKIEETSESSATLDVAVSEPIQSEEDVSGTGFVGDLPFPPELMRQFVVEMKAMSMVNKTLKDMEADVRGQYYRVGALVQPDADMRYPDCFAHELYTVALCFHPLRCLEALAAYMCGMMIVENGFEFRVKPQSMANVEIYEITTEDRPSLWLNCNAETYDRVEELTQKLTNTIAATDAGEYSLARRLEKVLLKRLELLDDDVSGVKIGRTEKEEEAYMTWMNEALNVAGELKIAILRSWQRSYIGSIFASGDVFVKTSSIAILHASHETTQGTTSSFYSEIIARDFLETCWAKRFRPGAFEQPIFDLEKNQDVLEKMKQYPQLAQGTVDIMDSQTNMRLEFLDLIAAPTSEYDRKLSEFQSLLATWLEICVTAIDIQTKQTEPALTVSELLKGPKNYDVFSSLFSVDFWNENKNACIQSACSFIVNADLKNMRMFYTLASSKKDDWVVGTGAVRYGKIRAHVRSRNVVRALISDQSVDLFALNVSYPEGYVNPLPSYDGRAHFEWLAPIDAAVLYLQLKGIPICVYKGTMTEYIQGFAMNGLTWSVEYNTTKNTFRIRKAHLRPIERALKAYGTLPGSKYYRDVEWNAYSIDKFAGTHTFRSELCLSFLQWVKSIISVASYALRLKIGLAAAIHMRTVFSYTGDLRTALQGSDLPTTWVYFEMARWFSGLQSHGPLKLTTMASRNAQVDPAPLAAACENFSDMCNENEKAGTNLAAPQAMLTPLVELSQPLSRKLQRVFTSEQFEVTCESLRKKPLGVFAHELAYAAIRILREDREFATKWYEFVTCGRSMLGLLIPDELGITMADFEREMKSAKKYWKKKIKAERADQQPAGI